jgi:hypothetical protein
MLFSSNGEVNFNKISGGNKILVRILLNFFKKIKKKLRMILNVMQIKVRIDKKDRANLVLLVFANHSTSDQDL